MNRKEFNNFHFLTKDIPCKRDCPNRAPECHSTCQAYMEWRSSRDKTLADKQKQAAVEAEAKAQITKFSIRQWKRNKK